MQSPLEKQPGVKPLNDFKAVFHKKVLNTVDCAMVLRSYNGDDLICVAKLVMFNMPYLYDYAEIFQRYETDSPKCYRVIGTIDSKGYYREEN